METEQVYVISKATKDQLKTYEEIQINLGWDPFKKGYLTFWEINPQGLFFGKINGKIVACILALKYSKLYGYISIFWVKQHYRKRGYGYQLFVKAMQFLSDCQIVILDSNGQNYKRWGFEDYCISLKRYVIQIPTCDQLRSTEIVTNPELFDFQKLSQYDQKYFPGQRLNFLKKSIQISHKTFISIDNISKNIKGYAIVTQCLSGYAIAPLIAQDDTVAQDLIKQIFTTYKDHAGCIVTFTLNQNPIISALMKKWFPLIMYQCDRMHKYQGKDFDRSHIYAFSGWERG